MCKNVFKVENIPNDTKHMKGMVNNMKKLAALFLALLMVSVLLITSTAETAPPTIYISKIDNGLAFESDALIMTPAFGDSILKIVKTVTSASDAEVKIGTDTHQFKWWGVAVCEWDDTEKAYVITAFKPADGNPATFEIPDNGFVLAVHVTDQTNDSTAFSELNKTGRAALAVGEKIYLYNINIAKATIQTSGTFASKFEEAGIEKGIEKGTELLDKDGEAYSGELVFDNFETESIITIGAPLADTTLKAYDPTAEVDESEPVAESEEPESKTETPDTGETVVPFIVLIGASAIGAYAISRKRK